MTSQINRLVTQFKLAYGHCFPCATPLNCYENNFNKRRQNKRIILIDNKPLFIMASVPTLRRRSELNYKTLHEGDPLPVPQQKKNINVVLPETYIVERLVWRKKNDQVSMIINLLLRFQDYQQTTLVDKHLTKPTHKNFTAKLKKMCKYFSC